MNWSEYSYFVEAMTVETAKDPSEATNMAALGMAGEVGEVVERVKKWLYHDMPLRREVLVDEMGDLFWYFTLMLRTHKIDLYEVMDENERKLKEKRSGHQKWEARLTPKSRE